MKNTHQITEQFFKTEYVQTNETRAIYAMLDELRHGRWIEKNRQVEIIQDYILKNEEVMKKLMHIAVLSSVNYDALSQIIDSSDEKLDAELKALEVDLIKDGLL